MAPYAAQAHWHLCRQRNGTLCSASPLAPMQAAPMQAPMQATSYHPCRSQFQPILQTIEMIQLLGALNDYAASMQHLCGSTYAVAPMRAPTRQHPCGHPIGTQSAALGVTRFQVSKPRTISGFAGSSTRSQVPPSSRSTSASSLAFIVCTSSWLAASLARLWSSSGSSWVS